MSQNLNIWNMFRMNQVQMRQSVVGAIRFLVNARVLQLECARILHEAFFVPVLMYGNETMLWKE